MSAAANSDQASFQQQQQDIAGKIEDRFERYLSHF
jgi:hypothetical protein